MDVKTLVHAIIGALVTIVTSFVPLSPIVGGAVAAWLEGGSREDGLLAGTLSGILVSLMLLPLLFIGLVLVPFDLGFTFVVMLFIVFLGTAYLVGFSALGGYIGTYLHAEFGSRDRRPQNGRRPIDDRAVDDDRIVDDRTADDDRIVDDRTADDDRIVDDRTADDRTAGDRVIDDGPTVDDGRGVDAPDDDDRPRDDDSSSFGEAMNVDESSTDESDENRR